MIDAASDINLDHGGFSSASIPGLKKHTIHSFEHTEQYPATTITIQSQLRQDSPSVHSTMRCECNRLFIWLKPLKLHLRRLRTRSQVRPYAMWCQMEGENLQSSTEMRLKFGKVSKKNMGFFISKTYGGTKKI